MGGESIREVSAEIALLLACSRPEAPSDAELHEHVRAVGDWDAVPRLAAHHHLVPLVAARLRQCANGVVPESTLAWFEERALATAVHNIAVTAHLIDVLTLLERNHIPAVPIRGPVLALQVYGSIARRHFQDLDVLITRRDLERAVRLLESHGYEMSDYYRCLLHGLYPHVEHHYPLTGRDGRPTVELHCEVTPWYFTAPIQTEDLFRRAGSVSLAGYTAKTLAPEDLLLILATHGTKHVWPAIQLVADVAWALHATPVCDWVALQERASQLGVLRILSVAVGLARDLLGSDSASPITLSQADARRANSLVAGLAKRLCGDPFHPGWWTPFWFNMRCRERTADKARCWTRNLLTGTIIAMSQPPFRRVPQKIDDR